MKKSIQFLSLTILTVFLFISCGNDDEVILQDLMLNKVDVIILVDQSEKVAITSGNGKYLVESADVSKATVQLQDESVIITGKDAGETLVTVIDKASKEEKTIKVTVNFKVSLDKNEVSLKKGESENLTVKGSGNYEVASQDQTIATGVISGDKLIVRAVNYGKTDITITDKNTQETFKVSVTVNPEAIVANPTSVTEDISNTSYYVELEGGSGNFTVTSSSEGIVTTEIQDRVVNNEVVGKQVKITPVKPGTTVLTINDGFQDIKVTVTINPVDLFFYPNGDVELEVEEEKLIKISQGNGGYSVEVISGADVISAVVEEVDPGAPVTPYWAVKLTGKSVGNAKIKIKDAGNKEEEVNVTVKVKESIFNVNAAGKVTLKPGKTAKGDVTIPNEGKYLADDLFNQNKDITSIDFNNATRTGYQSCYYAENLTKVVMNNVTTVEKNTFRFCKNLNSVSMNVVENIEFGAFYYNPALTKIELPSTIRNIGKYAFRSCTGLQEIKVKATTPPTLADQVFRSVTTANITLYVPTGSKSAYESSDWGTLFTKIEEF